MLVEALPWIGHISFGLTALSFLMKRILWLRLFAIASGALGIFYNSGIALGWVGPANPELWTVVGWIGLFFAINIVQSIMLLIRNSEVVLSEADRVLMAKAFPAMRSRDFKMMLSAGECRTVQDGEILVACQDQTGKVTLLVEGVLLATDQRGNTEHLRPGQFVGEISYAIGEQYGGSGHTVVAQGAAQIVEWDYRVLRKVVADPAMNGAVLDGFFRGLVKKNSLLMPLEVAPESAREVHLPQEQRLLNASTFGSLRSSQFAKLIGLAEVTDYGADSPIEIRSRIGVIASGACRIRRPDGYFVDIGTGRLLGEVGFVSEKVDRYRADVVALRACKIYWWDREGIVSLARRDPPVFAAFMKDVAQDMANKLIQPLQGHSFSFACRFDGCDEFDYCKLNGEKVDCGRGRLDAVSTGEMMLSKGRA